MVYGFLKLSMPKHSPEVKACNGKLVEHYPICLMEHKSFCPLRRLQSLLLSLRYCDRFQGTSPLDKYHIVKKLDRGFFGETWIVTTYENGLDEFVLKKIWKQHMGIYQSGLRECHFGNLIMKSSWEEGKEHIVRFVDSFDHGDDLYIVSSYGGMSLSHLIYDEVIVNGVVRKTPSSWWRWMKGTNSGREAMKAIIFQLLKAVKFCHQHNITHRDLKPTNMVVCFSKDEGSCSIVGRVTGDAFREIHMRIIDFGSALDDFSVHNLYLPYGPSRAEQYSSYIPPEALLNDSWLHGPSTSKYDMWTVGQIIMELILGSPEVFSIDDVDRKILNTATSTDGYLDDDSLLVIRSFLGRAM